MASKQNFGDVGVDIGDDFVATAEIHRPPHNYFDAELIRDLATAFEALDEAANCRAIVLCSEGKNFCAGAQFGGGAQPKPSAEGAEPPGHLYDEAVRLFATRTPVVAAIQGAAIGGGLGLALMPDFRIAAPEARFAANFARLGLHHGFGLSVTLPDLVGGQKAMELLYTGRRLRADEALAIGLVDRIAPLEELREAAGELAREIAGSAPLAVRSIRETLRGDLSERIRAATDHEKVEQDRLQQTKDCREGIRAMGERRTPDFTGT
jgi:2-(1,2-epoxy-1,2-dihydrophenyl)acetyl-CoA isomerase